MQSLLYVDKDIFTGMLNLLTDFHFQGCQLDSYITQDKILPVIERWGDEFRYNKSV